MKHGMVKRLGEELAESVGLDGGTQRITHGRHCTCTPCSRQDWSEPQLAPCGMHGKDCPPEYQPLGGAGEVVRRDGGNHDGTQ